MGHLKSVVAIKLKIPGNKVLFNAMEEYSKCISYITNIGFKNNISNRYKLHHLVYYGAKEKFNLKSQFIINAIRIASQTLKSIKANKGSMPTFKKYMPVNFDKRTFTFSFNKVRLTTLNGRIDIPIEIPEYYWKYLDWKYQTATLTIDKKNKMFINITFRRSNNVVNSDSSNKIIGVDLGINHVAVTSKKQFFSGNKVKNTMLNFKHLRTKLQAKGTRPAKRLLKKISGREQRFKAWVNHNISKAIISSCNAGDAIVMENLRGIRNTRKGKRFNFWLNTWSFNQLQGFIEYKARLNGIKVIKVNPYNTSRICSMCSSKGTRTKGFFHCNHCGFSLNADLNASYNLAKHNSMPDCVLADVNQPHSQSDEAKALQGTEAELMANAQR